MRPRRRSLVFLAPLCLALGAAAQEAKPWEAPGVPAAPSPPSRVKPLKPIAPQPARPEPEQRAPPPPLPLGRMLRKGFTAKLRMRFLSYFHSRVRSGVDSTRDFMEGTFLWTERLAWSAHQVDAEGWIEGGGLTEGYSQAASGGRDLKRGRNHLEVKVLHYTRKAGRVYLGVGRRPLETIGIAAPYSPAQRAARLDLNDPDPGEPRQLGLWQASAVRAGNNWSLSCYWLPVFEPSKLPSSRSRWSGDDTPELGAGDFNFALISTATTRDRYPRQSLSNSRTFVRASGTVAGWEGFAAYFHGPSPHAVLKEEKSGVFLREYPHAHHVSGGLEKQFGALVAHAESLYQASPLRRDDDFVNTVAGFRYTIDDKVRELKLGLESIELTADYAWESLVRRKTDPEVRQSSMLGRAGRGTFFTRVELVVSTKLSAILGSVYDRHDGGRLETYGLKGEVVKNLDFRAWAEVYNGPPRSALGFWRKNDRAVMQATYSF